jgi:hypothetical protein
MTDTYRIDCLEKSLTHLLEGGVDTEWKELKPTVKELLTLAMRESPSLGPVGMCGYPCDGTCKCCTTFDSLLKKHFTTPVEPDEDEAWEKEVREAKEMDELEDSFCATCGNLCIQYEVDSYQMWLCETCYYGNEPVEIGLCGFPCDGRCRTCNEGGYDPNGEI